MGKILSGILGTNNDFVADTGGQNFAQALAKAQTQMQGVYGRQNTLADVLTQQMGGMGPNPAQAMLNQATDKNIANNAALIASSKGINPAIAQRLASQNAAMISQEAAGQAALMNDQQRLSAQNQLGGLYGNMAGNALGQQQITQNALNASNSINAGVANQNAQTAGQLVGGIMSGFGAMGSSGIGAEGQSGGSGGGAKSGAGMMAMFSDENLKDDVRSSDVEVDKFLDSLSGSKYSYKDPGMGSGDHVSPMAQNVEGTTIGRQMVKDTPSGKVIDYGKGFGGLAAALARLNERIDGLESKKMASGGYVQGEEVVPGDSEQNDTVPIMASAGEIVIPKSKASDPAKAKAFIDAIMGHKKSKNPSSEGYGKILELKRRISALEKKVATA